MTPEERMKKTTFTFEMTHDEARKYKNAAEEVQYILSAVEGIFDMTQCSISMGNFDQTEMAHIATLCGRAMTHAIENEGEILAKMSTRIFEQQTQQVFPEAYAAADVVKEAINANKS